MPHSQLRRAFASAVALALAAGVMGAAPARADWQADWAKLVAAAKAEGEVVVGAPRPAGVQRAVTELWKRDFPDIALKMSPAGTEDWPVRLKLEREGGKYLWDVYFSGPSVPIFPLSREVFDPVAPALLLPEVNDPKVWGGWNRAFVDRDGTKLFSMWQQLTSIYYNTKTVDPARVKAAGLKLLLEPEFKGQIVMADPRGRGPGINPLQLVYKILGEDAMRRVFVDQEPTLHDRGATATEAFVRGKGKIYMADNILVNLGPYTDAGLKLDVRPFGNTATTAYASVGSVLVGLINKAPHPSAARVFINWVLTRDIQAEIAKRTNYDTRRRDVPQLLAGEFAMLPDEEYLVFQREEFQAERRGLQQKLRAWRPN